MIEHAPPMIEALYRQHLLALRTLVAEGRPSCPLLLSRADLERFDLWPWRGMLFGMMCDLTDYFPPRTGTHYLGGRL